MNDLDAQPWVLDACVIVNLAAVFSLDSLPRVFNRSLIVVDEAAAESLYSYEETDGERVRKAITLDGLDVVPLGDGDLDLFVSLSASLSDGEAATLAYAHGRSFTVVTDDRPARAAAGRLNPTVPVIGTSVLLRHYCERLTLPCAELSRIVQRVERRASFRPRRDDANHEWWKAACAGSAEEITAG